VKTLTQQQVRHFYNWFGSWHDRQPYENRAFDVLVARGDFSRAQAVFEFGCGTGRFAERLLRDCLPPDARYIGIDISDTMVRLATRRLRPWADRAIVRTGNIWDEPDGQFDRVISTYVLDLLSDNDARRTVAEAHRVLTTGGYLCVASLTFGQRPCSRISTTVWRLAYAIQPVIVGGCRPVHLLDFVPTEEWRVVHHETVVEWTLASEVLVASRDSRPVRHSAINVAITLP
jgi:SAM-dependent methyltransferase